MKSWVWFLGPHKVDIVGHTWIPALRWGRQENQKFKFFLNHIKSSRISWATWDNFWKKNWIKNFNSQKESRDERSWRKQKPVLKHQELSNTTHNSSGWFGLIPSLLVYTAQAAYKIVWGPGWNKEAWMSPYEFMQASSQLRSMSGKWYRTSLEQRLDPIFQDSGGLLWGIFAPWL